VRLGVRVQPRASRDAIVGERGGSLLVRVQAAPVDGAANQALCRLLARALGLPPSAVRVLRGETAREKLVWLAGARMRDVQQLASGTGATR
jgi:uncharacterized protein YggU (UPF0235/DUF167 family)